MKPLHRDPTYLTILYYIERNGKAYPDELAHRLGVTRQAVEYRLKRLTEEGLISKERGDRIYYVLTEKGRAIVRSANRGLGSDKRGTMDSIRSEDVKARLKSKLFLLPIAIGLISMGQHIAGGDPARGIISLFIWIMVGGFTYLLTSK